MEKDIMNDNITAFTASQQICGSRQQAEKPSEINNPVK